MSPCSGKLTSAALHQSPVLPTHSPDEPVLQAFALLHCLGEFFRLKTASGKSGSVSTRTAYALQSTAPTPKRCTGTSRLFRTLASQPSLVRSPRLRHKVVQRATSSKNPSIFCLYPKPAFGCSMPQDPPRGGITEQAVVWRMRPCQARTSPEGDRRVDTDRRTRVDRCTRISRWGWNPACNSWTRRANAPASAS